MQVNVQKWRGDLRAGVWLRAYQFFGLLQRDIFALGVVLELVGGDGAYVKVGGGWVVEDVAAH
ncbi:MAG: hypothetical protein A2X16_00415 [Bacteroidetes bacterium GWF2_39_10]|nr:MAG: hypothetical protein A2X16_00415 [Bacteroidetes bacterium GWF2_39_10]OFZ06936.1 MAG: hypothetical protein A2322_08050 [Bacteroidetes bacterium RIFOXYB2_FULL_39_7]